MIAEQIKSLRTAHGIEAAPQRTGTGRATAEEPVTSRILRRAKGPSDVDSGVIESGVEEQGAEKQMVPRPSAEG